METTANADRSHHPTIPPPAPTVGTFIRIDVAGQVKTDQEALDIKAAISSALTAFPGMRLQMSLIER